MSEVLKGAGIIAGNEFDQEQTPAGTGAKPVAQVDSATIDALKKGIQDSADVRAAYSASHVVKQGIVERQPVSERIIDAKAGKISNGDEQAAVKAINNELEKFGKIVGRSVDSMTDEMTPAEKFPYVKEVAEREKAQAVLDLLMTIKQNPSAPQSVYINTNPNYSFKGFVVAGPEGDVNYGPTEFKNMLLAETTGGLYGEGSIVDGAPVDKATAFALNIARPKVKKATKGEKPTTGAGEDERRTTMAVLVKNKGEFVKKNSAIVIMFPTIENPTDEQKKTTKAKAVIIVNGKEVPATFKAEARNEKGELIMVGGGIDKKTGKQKEQKPKKATYSLSLSVMVKPSEGTPIANLGTLEEVVKKFEITLAKGGSGAAPVNYLDVQAFIDATAGKTDKDGNVTNSVIVRLMSAMASGEMDMSKDNDVAKLINSAKGAGSQAAEAQSAADKEAVL